MTRSAAAGAGGKFSTFLLSQRGPQDEVGGLRVLQMSKKSNKASSSGFTISLFSLHWSVGALILFIFLKSELLRDDSNQYCGKARHSQSGYLTVQSVVGIQLQASLSDH